MSRRGVISSDEARNLYGLEKQETERKARPDKLPDNTTCKDGHTRKRYDSGKLGCPTCSKNASARSYAEQNEHNRCRKCGGVREGIAFRKDGKKYRFCITCTKSVGGSRGL